MDYKAIFNSVENYRYQITYLFLNILLLYMDKLYIVQRLKSGNYTDVFLEEAITFREFCIYSLLICVAYVCYTLKRKTPTSEKFIILFFLILTIIYSSYTLLGLMG